MYIENCTSCYYNYQDNITKCYLCDNNFAMFEFENKCLNKEQLKNHFLYLNDTHVEACENIIDYCMECSDESTCTKCLDKYLLVQNENRTFCVEEEVYNMGEIYLSDDGLTYLYCNQNPDIPYCLTCHNKSSCSSCREDYTLIDGDTSKCVEKESLGNNYIQDPNDRTSYVKCEKVYDKCDTCNNERCLTCQGDYIFVNDDYSACVEIPPTTIPPTNPPTEENIIRPSNENANKTDDKSTNNDDDEEDNDVDGNTGTAVVTKSEALQKANISLSYEKINNFNYNEDEKKITYDLSLLTTVGEVKTGDEITVNVNLIYTNGTRNSESTKSTCKVQNIAEQSGSARATFSCSIDNIEGDFYSLRYNSSDSVCGVPDDETSLDPVLTQKYKNTEETKILPTFIYESINHSTCKSTGTFTIKGKITEKIEENIKFTILLTYPEGITLTCQFNEDQDELSCKADRDISNKTLIIEQTLINQNGIDYFNLKSITSQDRLICSNAILQESVAKSNVSLSFRQVSHFKSDSNGCSFVLIALASEKISQGTTMQANIYVNNEKTDRAIECTLENNVDPENGQSQGNFLCSVDKSTSEYWSTVDFTNVSISLSPNNDNIGGVSELDETSASPAATDEEISKIKEKKQNNEEINALTNIVDYYEVETKVNTLTIESIDVDKCNTTGKLTLKGSFSDNFEEDINFDLPLTYPSAQLKCELKKVSQNTVTDIKCKSQTEFKSVDSVVIEPRIIKKKNQELFMIAGKTFTLNGKKSCLKYDNVKSNVLEQRESSGISFALVDALEVVNQALQFFMGVSRESENIPFSTIYNFLTSLIVSTRRRLRTLEESTISDIPVTCTLNQSLVVGLIGGYDCVSDTNNIKGTPLSMELATDDVMDISGIENINLQSATDSNIDYSNIEMLKLINELPKVDIDSVNGTSCSENGEYIVYGNISNVSNLETSYSDIELYMSSTESVGLCEVDINKDEKNLTMTCQNRDKFDMSQIMFPKTFVKNSNGTFIFVINSYTSPEQFSCDISPNSIKSEDVSINTPSPSSSIPPGSSRGNISRRPKISDGGLSGGAIALIVVVCVVAIITIGIIIILIKKDIISCKTRKQFYDYTTVVGMNSDIN